MIDDLTAHLKNVPINYVTEYVKEKNKSLVAIHKQCLHLGDGGWGQPKAGSCEHGEGGSQM